MATVAAAEAPSLRLLAIGTTLGRPKEVRNRLQSQKFLLGRRTFKVRSLASPIGSWEDGQYGIIWEDYEIAEASGGILVQNGPPGSISTDSRSVHRGEWFLALAGTNFDGNAFLHQALEAGASGAIGRSMPNDWPVGFVQVNDGLQALKGLARSVRRRYRGPVIGITGSTGKTTTTALTALTLESLGHIHRTQGNRNNRIGVSLTLLQMPSFSAACVLEMGMDRSGEILELCGIAEPSVRVVLNVGPAHLEHFSSLEDIAAAKGELLLNAKDGDVCILNVDDPLVMSLPLPKQAKLWTFGSSQAANLRLVSAQGSDRGRAVKFVLEENTDPYARVQAKIRGPGIHLAVNACAACCVARSLGVRLQTAAASSTKYVPLEMRSSLELLSSDVQLINDAYNSNPISVAAALEVLKGLNCKGRKILALGDMLELGDMTRQAHMNVLSMCEEVGVSMVGLAGRAFYELTDRAEQAFEVVRCQDARTLADRLVEKLKPGDAVLVKGSRKMKMEAVVDAIRSAFPPTPRAKLLPPELHVSSVKVKRTRVECAEHEDVTGSIALKNKKSGDISVSVPGRIRG